MHIRESIHPCDLLIAFNVDTSSHFAFLLSFAIYCVVCVGPGVQDAACRPPPETHSQAGAEAPVDPPEGHPAQQPAPTPGPQAGQGTVSQQTLSRS